MKTVGELYDALKAVAAAESAVADAYRSIGHGGNESTMRGKHEVLDSSQNWLEYLREQPLVESVETDAFIAEFFGEPRSTCTGW